MFFLIGIRQFEKREKKNVQINKENVILWGKKYGRKNFLQILNDIFKESFFIQTIHCNSKVETVGYLSNIYKALII